MNVPRTDCAGSALQQCPVLDGLLSWKGSSRGEILGECSAQAQWHDGVKVVWGPTSESQWAMAGLTALIGCGRSSQSSLAAVKVGCRGDRSPQRTDACRSLRLISQLVSNLLGLFQHADAGIV